MEDELLNFLFKLPRNFPLADFQQIASMLEQADLLVPGYIPPDVGMYDLRGYLYSSMVEGIRIVMVPDRNIVSRLAKATMGCVANDQQRLAAAVLAFAQCLEIQIEPSVAFHELGPAQGNALAYEELARFRLADNSPVSVWIDLALGRTSSISGLGAPIRLTYDHDLAQPLRRWRSNYIVALKVGELELLPLEPFERTLKLIQWMRDDFIIAGPAAVFACHYFAPTFPRKRLLKGLRSQCRERALAGISNAAWDITYLSEFARSVNSAIGSNTRYVFASLDDGLRRIGRTLSTLAREDSARDSMIEVLASWWPDVHAQAIADRFTEVTRQPRDSAWYEHQRNSPNAISELIDLGEARLRDWAPSPRRSKSETKDPGQSMKDDRGWVELQR